MTPNSPQVHTANHATFPIRIRKITVHICVNPVPTLTDRQLLDNLHKIVINILLRMPRSISSITYFIKQVCEQYKFYKGPFKITFYSKSITIIIFHKRNYPFIKFNNMFIFLQVKMNAALSDLTFIIEILCKTLSGDTW